MSNIERKIPLVFEQLDSFDDRFLKVKIYLMHLGENANGSYFSKEVVQDAIPSLANTPILGYIIDSDGNVDFTDHKMVLSKNSKGKYELKYIGQAFGVIPESCNPQFEMKVCDDGVEREFLTVEGLMWNKWDTPIDIMLRDYAKNQSMELDEKYDGYFDKEDKLFHFTKIKFFGACILGDDVRPAMNSADIEVQFSMANNDWQIEIQENMEQFKALYASRYQSNTDNDINSVDKDGENMKEEMLNILAKYSVSQEIATEKGIDLEAEYESLEHFETKVKEVFAAEPVVDPVVEPTPEPTPAPTFSLTGEQFVSELREELAKSQKTDQYGYVYQDLWYVDYLPDQNVVIAYDCDEGELVGLNYSPNGDDIVIDFNSRKEYKVQYVPSTDPEDEVETEFTLVPKAFSASQLNKAVAKAKEDTVEEVKTQYAQVEADKVSLESEIVALRQFKASKEAEEREAQVAELFAQFSEQLSEDELTTAREQFAQLDVSEIEKELFAMVGKKAAQFSAKKPKANTNVKVPVFSTPQDPSQPSYAYIIEKAIKKD